MPCSIELSWRFEAHDNSFPVRLHSIAEYNADMPIVCKYHEHMILFLSVLFLGYCVTQKYNCNKWFGFDLLLLHALHYEQYIFINMKYTWTA